MTTTINASVASGIVATGDTSGTLALQTGGTSALYIDASQNTTLGNGTGQQTVKVSAGASGSSGGGSFVVSNGGSTIFSAGGYSAVFGGAYDGSAAINAATSLTFQATTGSMYWNVNGSERMRIDSDGNMLLGTTSNLIAGTRLSVLGGTSQSQVCTFKTQAANGNYSFLNSSGTQVGYIQSGASSTVYSTSSDYRLKEDVQPMRNALEKVALLNPVTYKWKIDGAEGQGFIAHELQAVVPDCVQGEKDAVDEEGKPVYQGVDTSFLVATLTAAIKELKAIVDAQQQEINELKGVK